MSTERWFLDMYKRKKMPGQKCKINLQMCLCLISTQYPEAPLMNYFRLQRVMAFVIVNLDMCLVRLFTKHVCLGFCTPCLLHNRCQSVGFGTQVLDHPRTKPAQEGLTEKLPYAHTKLQFSNATTLSSSEVSRTSYYTYLEHA